MFFPPVFLIFRVFLPKFPFSGSPSLPHGRFSRFWAIFEPFSRFSRPDCLSTKFWHVDRLPPYDSISAGQEVDGQPRWIAWHGRGPMQTKYTPYLAMEIAIAATVIFFGYALTAIRDHPYWTVRGGVAFLAVLIMWFAMQRIVVADDAIVLYRRFGWFKRRIPLAQVAGVDAKMIPGPDGGYPTLYVYTTDKRKFRVSLFSNDRHIQVIVDVRARMNRLKTAQKNAAAGAAQPAS